MSPSDSSGLPGATITLLKGNTIAYMNSTGPDGEISFYTQAPYIIKVKCLGYNTYVDTIKNQQKNITINLTENTQQLNDVVVTAQYGNSSADNSTYKIKVIDSKKISELAAVNLRDALSNELNIRFSQDNALGMCSMNMQGISGQNIKVLIDGVPMIGRQDGNLDLSQINMNNVERIEIIEGPASVNYGTDALAGVINIITKKPKKNKIETNLQTYYESNNNYNANASFAIQKKKHGFKVNIGRNYFNGWRQTEDFYFLPKKTLADTLRFKNWKPREQYFAGIDYNYASKRVTFNYKISGFKEWIMNRGLPIAPYFETAFDDYYKTIRFDNTLITNFKLKKQLNFNNTIGYNYYERKKNTWFKNLTTLDQNLSTDPSLQDTSLFNLFMARGVLTSSKPFIEYIDSIKKTNRMNFEIGYDINHESTYGKRIESKSQTIYDIAGFASTEIQLIQDLILRPGLRYSYNSVYNAPLTPSIHLKYEKRKWVLRASYARGFRAPSLKELYFNFVDVNHNIIGNTNLLAETSHNMNVSFKFKPSKKNVSIDQGFFYNNINNLITLGIIDGTQYTYLNIGKYITYGSAFNLNYTYKDLSISCGGAFLARYNQISEEYIGAKKYNYTPEARTSIKYELKKIKTSINVFYKYSGQLTGIGVNDNNEIYQTYISDYHTLDINFSKALFKNKLKLSIGSKNIFNVTNLQTNSGGDGVHSSGSISTSMAMGRTYFIKLDYAFSK